ncbi:MAG: amidohydrolase [Chryseolinea sp.]
MQSIFYNGIILTQNKNQPQASAMVVEGDKIVAVGNDADVVRLKTSNTKLIDLKGKTILPGFNDAHIHVWKVGQLESFIIDLRGIKSIEALQKKVKALADKLPVGTWIIGRGFNEQVLEDKRMPIKEDLDAISTQHPIYLIRTCAHIASVNTLALKKANVNSSSVAPLGGVVGKTESGELTGIFYETALGLITKYIPPPSHDDYQQMIKVGADKMLSYGITSATDPAVHPELLEAYLDLDKKGKASIRFNLMPILLPDGGAEAYPVPQKYKSEKIKIDTVKFFSDGGLSGKTASLKRAYKKSNDRGVLRLKREHFLSLARAAQQKGFRIGTHAIGDVAIDLVLDVYKALHLEFGNTRNRIEHFGLPSDENINDVATYGFVPVPQTIFIDELGENFRSSLDDEYLERCYPVRTLLDMNIPVAFSTDAPVVKNINPWSCIKAAITRKTSAGNVISPQESITIQEAIYAYTMGSAFADGQEDIKGSIESGKLADFIIVDKNPLQILTEEIDSIKVEATYVGGTILYSKS